MRPLDAGYEIFAFNQLDAPREPSTTTFAPTGARS